MQAKGPGHKSRGLVTGPASCPIGPAIAKAHSIADMAGQVDVERRLSGLQQRALACAHARRRRGGGSLRPRPRNSGGQRHCGAPRPPPSSLTRGLHVCQQRLQRRVLSSHAVSHSLQDGSVLCGDGKARPAINNAASIQQRSRRCATVTQGCRQLAQPQPAPEPPPSAPFFR